MNCPTDEILRARVDEELAPEERAAVDQHIAECPACQSRSKAVSAAAARVGTLLGTLDVSASAAESNPQMALARFKARLNPHEERVPLLARIFAPRWRFAWAASLAAVIVAGSLCGVGPAPRRAGGVDRQTGAAEHVQVRRPAGGAEGNKNRARAYSGLRTAAGARPGEGHSRMRPARRLPPGR